MICLNICFRNGSTFQSTSTRTLSLQYYKMLLQGQVQSDDDSPPRTNINDNQHFQLNEQKAKEKKVHTTHVIVSNVYAITVNNQSRGNLSTPARYVFETTERGKIKCTAYPEPLIKLFHFTLVSALSVRYEYYIALWDGDEWLPTQRSCHFNQTGVSLYDHVNLTVADCTLYGTIAIMKVGCACITKPQYKSVLTIKRPCDNGWFRLWYLLKGDFLLKKNIYHQWMFLK